MFGCWTCERVHVGNSGGTVGRWQGQRRHLRCQLCKTSTAIWFCGIMEAEKIMPGQLFSFSFWTEICGLRQSLSMSQQMQLTRYNYRYLWDIFELRCFPRKCAVSFATEEPHHRWGHIFSSERFLWAVWSQYLYLESLFLHLLFYFFN